MPVTTRHRGTSGHSAGSPASPRAAAGAGASAPAADAPSGRSSVRMTINIHKGLCPLVIAAMMVYYNNYSLAAYLYLVMHGMYGLLWLVKDYTYPDKQFMQPIPILGSAIGVVVLGLYWVAPFLLISRPGLPDPSPPFVAGVLALYVLGTFLHYVSDCQKYYTLKYRPGLIDEGLFAYCRNTNYLGEMLIYGAMALLAQHWGAVAVIMAFWVGIFAPNMIKKDKSLSRYPGFEAYKSRSGLILPWIL